MSREVIPPKVSVCVITYNQEAYIGPCLQSIVDQKTDFEFEVVVGDDASTDSTPSVVQDFADRYPTRIRPIYQQSNVGGGARNFRTVHMAASGQYVAHVDGDDLILPGKLQAQVDMLDARPDVAFAAHAVRVIGSNQLMGANIEYPEFGTVDDLLRLGTYFVHSSIMYRRDEGNIVSFPEDCVDFYMHIERAMHGSIYLDKRVFGCYRLHDAGISKQQARRRSHERAYELAFDRAKALGMDARRVEVARIAHRMRAAVTRCMAGDNPGYRELVRLQPQDWKHASLKHILLHLTRMTPSVVHLYFFFNRLRQRT